MLKPQNIPEQHFSQTIAGATKTMS